MQHAALQAGGRREGAIEVTASGEASELRMREYPPGGDNANSRSGKQHTHLFSKTCVPDALLQSCPHL